MHILFQTFFCLQFAVGASATTAQKSTHQPEKTLTVTMTPQSSGSSISDKKKVSADLKRAYTMSFLDEENDRREMIFMLPTNLKMVRENYLGVFTSPVSTALTSQFPGILAPREGLLVKYVHANSPAALAGCKPYDILVALGHTKLKSSHQLRELVTGYSGGQRVSLSLIRTAKLRTINVELAKRKNIANFSILNTKNGYSVGVVKFADPRLYTPVDYQLNGRRMDRGYFTFLRQNAKHSEDPVWQQVATTRSISVETHDGKNFVVGWNTTARSKSLRGTLFEIRKKSSRLPKEFQAMVRRNLDVTETSLKIERSSIKLHVKPRLVGKDYALRLNLVHPAVKNDVLFFRCFELDHVFTEKKPIRMSGLLTLQLLNDELKKMKPGYRNAIVATLKKLPAPKVKVELENSQ